eukprot:CAMPEP_0182857962 /NCGR_PEP_ID=MMETSP0034_2-20130328/3373_1 /TAXON_ID=156128 /ORGANISM="Nephroselmis pyriformis, Strain CCMP717" /LENGTH=197 /DNA_ID=CAMNT_0024989279 /DNA_START=113 /DNA_END=704 /DNA_ORIENTATION=-
MRSLGLLTQLGARVPNLPAPMDVHRVEGLQHVQLSENLPVPRLNRRPARDGQPHAQLQESFANRPRLGVEREGPAPHVLDRAVVDALVGRPVAIHVQVALEHRVVEVEDSEGGEGPSLTEPLTAADSSLDSSASCGRRLARHAHPRAEGALAAEGAGRIPIQAGRGAPKGDTGPALADGAPFGKADAIIIALPPGML